MDLPCKMKDCTRPGALLPKIVAELQLPSMRGVHPPAPAVFNLPTCRECARTLTIADFSAPNPLFKIKALHWLPIDSAEAIEWLRLFAKAGGH